MQPKIILFDWEVIQKLRIRRKPNPMAVVIPKTIIEEEQPKSPIQVCKYREKCSRRDTCLRAHNVSDIIEVLCTDNITCENRTSTCKYIHTGETRDMYYQRLLNVTQKRRNKKQRKRR